MSARCLSPDLQPLLSSQVDKVAKHSHAINAGIVASLTQFIGALSDITGQGRPHDKVRQSMQVRRLGVVGSSRTPEIDSVTGHVHRLPTQTQSCYPNSPP